jgi:hypothetical protein
MPIAGLLGPVIQVLRMAYIRKIFIILHNLGQLTIVVEKMWSGIVPLKR